MLRWIKPSSCGLKMSVAFVHLNTSHNFFHEEDLALTVEFVEDDGVKTEDNSSQFFHEEDVALSTELHDDDHSAAVRKTGEWYIDSAATRHMTYEKDNLMDF